MLNECIEGLNIDPDGIYFDGTLGGGGHSLEIVKRLKTGGLIAVDRDGEALKAAQERLKAYSDRITFVHDDFKNGAARLDELNIDYVDGVLLDLGVSSHQIDVAERGFSYRLDGELDMRMDREQRLTAFEVVNEYSEEELARIFFQYGEERFSRRIAENILKGRARKPIRTTGELAEIVTDSIPTRFRYADGNPCKRAFQGLRIFVNSELSGLYEGVLSLAGRLKRGGIIEVISFHSLEDRLVKQAFKYMESECVCPKGMPICTCGKVKQGIILTKKPLSANEDELKLNPRAGSAKLRILKKI
jgi:16S rRNA (cytosine1402-N4)-methyltransferase